MLNPYRVLDLTNANGYLCGKILADLGADVIKIEKPGGDPGRHLGPFYQDVPHSEKSLYWFAYNSNKRGITLNIETADGKELLKKLARKADFVLESFNPGYMENLRLGYPVLNRINPRLIMTSITPFGQSGPYKNYHVPDLVGMAMGGYMHLTGDRDRPPVTISYPQAYFHAAASAAVASLSALHYRETHGGGQQVDVSMQQCIVKTMLYARPTWELNRVKVQRMGSSRMLATGVVPRQTWPCKDGFVTFVIIGGTVGARSNRALTEWMDSEGFADDFVKNFDWKTLDIATATQEFFNRIEAPIGKFFTALTKSELYEGAAKRGVWLYPVATTREILENKQLAARDYWVEVEHPELNRNITYPGAFAKLSLASNGIKRRAPLIGEHNLEIYEGELGLSRADIMILKRVGVL